MTREEAIEKLQKQKAEYLEEWVDYSGVAEAYDMAIDALSAVCDDCIWHVCNYNKVDWGALPSAEVVDCTDFIEWLVDRVLDETIWKYNSVAYGEIICRKLVKLGVLEVTEEPSYYIRHIKNNTKESDLVYRPSAEATKVVTCRDCKNRAMYSVCDCLGYEDDYCSRGERKGGDSE